MLSLRIDEQRKSDHWVEKLALKLSDSNNKRIINKTMVETIGF